MDTTTSCGAPLLRFSLPLPSSWTDLDLITALLARDERAWAELDRRYRRLLFRCIQKVTNRFRSVLGSDDEEEIYAELMCSLAARDMHKIRAYSGASGNKFSSWLGLLATNAAYDHLRRIARAPHATTIADVPDSELREEATHEDLSTEKRWSLVNRTLAGFSDRDREFVRLFYVEGKTADDVAEEMRISVKTVYSKKHKIRARLERELAPVVRAAA